MLQVVHHRSKHTQWSRCLETWSHVLNTYVGVFKTLANVFKAYGMSLRHLYNIIKTSPMSWRHFRSEWGGMSQDIYFSILQCLDLKCLEMFCRCLWRTICPILVYAINVWLTMNQIVVFQLLSWFVTSSCEPMAVDLETQRFRTFKLLNCLVSQKRKQKNIAISDSSAWVNSSPRH